MKNDWFYVYPRGDKLDLTTKVEPVAAFKIERHAFEFVRKWPETGEVWLNGEVKVDEAGQIDAV